MLKFEASNDDAERVAIACAKLYASGTYPGVRSVNRYLRQHLGGGLRTERVSELIRQWEQAANPSRKPKGNAPPATPETSLDEVLDSYPDLLPVVESLARALEKVLAARSEREIQERAHHVQAAVEVARADLAASHAAELAERETLLTALRTRDAEQAAEIEALEEAMRRLTSELESSVRRAESAEAAVAEHEHLREELSLAKMAIAVATEARTQAVDVIGSLRADLQAERVRNEQLHQRVERLAAELGATATRRPRESGRSSAKP